MEIESYVDRREVMIHFLAIEEHKVPGDYVRKSTRELEDTVRHLCFTKDTNPFGIYMVGKENDRRDQLIGEWVLAMIPSNELYSCGVDDRWNPFLERKKGNLLAVARSSLGFPLLDDRNEINKILEIIVTVKQSTSGREGRFEVIDGFHRAIAMIGKGRENVRSYVGLHRGT